jgi:hypothetical protein
MFFSDSLHNTNFVSSRLEGSILECDGFCTHSIIIFVLFQIVTLASKVILQFVHIDYCFQGFQKKNTV